MRTRTLAVPVIVAALCSGNVALAGLRLGGPVVVSPSGMYAYGSIGFAYNTNTNYTEVIGCTVYGSASFSYGSCWATDAAGVSRSCFTTLPEHLANIRSINGNSNISIYWNASGQCTEILVGQYSYTDPKVWGGTPR